jgi:hypothetical protein
MGPHLHNELRIRPFPGSYDHDTIDPSILYQALGIDWIGGRTEIHRKVGGQFLIREGGPSDCRAGQHPDSSFAGYRGLGSVPSGYVDPATSNVRSKYTVFGTSRSNQNVESPALQPPDYAPGGGAGPSSGAGSIGAGELMLGAAGLVLLGRLILRGGKL